jgi:hypothetical protein
LTEAEQAAKDSQLQAEIKLLSERQRSGLIDHLHPVDMMQDLVLI